MSIFRKLSWFFKREKKSYFIAIIALFIVALLNILPPRIIGIVVDEIETGALTTRSLVTWLAILAFVAVSQYALRYVWRVRIWGNAARLERIVRGRLFNHFTEMDNEFFQKYRTGDLMAHATNDLRGLRMVAGGGILMIADTVSVGLTTILAMIFVVNWRLTLIAILPMPLLAVVANFLGKKLHFRFRRAQAAFSNLNDKVQESIQGMKVIKTFGQEKEDLEEFKVQTDQVVEENKSVYKVDSLFDPAITLITGLSYIFTILIGGSLVMNDTITIGDFVTFINYINMLVWPMMAVGRLFNILERGNASYDRINNLMSESSSIVEMQGATDKPITGDLEFDIKEFYYPGSDTPVLQNISIYIQKGHTLGIVGKTGAGKTTLFKLLLREYDEYEGSIRFNGQDIREYTLDALLENVGYVPQDNFLFSQTIRENIRFANPDLTQEEVEYAARMASVHDDIVSLPEGYDTEVGERGVSLSGGQKQRTSIARSLAVDPEILILDDSLSAVDAETEETILSNLKKERQNKTTIISAHRISSVMHAEEIIVMDEGQIVERGTHEGLLMNDGWYKEMYEQQQLERQLKGDE